MYSCKVICVFYIYTCIPHMHIYLDLHRQWIYMYLCIYFTVHSIGGTVFPFIILHRHFHFFSLPPLPHFFPLMLPVTFKYSCIWFIWIWSTWQTRFYFAPYSYLLSHTQFESSTLGIAFLRNKIILYIHIYIYKYGFVRVNVCPLQPSAYICHLCNVYINSNT